MASNSQIARIRPLLIENTPLIPVLDELILEYLRSIYEHYEEFLSIPIDSIVHTYVMNLKTIQCIVVNDLSSTNTFFYEGEINMIRISTVEFKIIIMQGTRYVAANCFLAYDDTLSGVLNRRLSTIIPLKFE